MKKILNWILILVLTCSALFVSPTVAKAEDLSVSGIPSEVLVGNTFTVSVKVPANIGGKLYVSYPKDSLTFKSGSDGVYGGNGLLNANVFFNSSEVTVTFQATAVGTVDLSIYMEEAEYSDKDPSEALPTIPKVTKSIKIVNEIYSDDNSLSMMYLSKGDIYPDFSPSTTTYTTTVDYSVTSVRVTATPSHPKATIVSVSGNENLQVGQNTISVVVKAESGATATYKIIVTRAEKPADAPDDPSESETTGNTEGVIEGTDSGFDWNGKDLYFTESIPEASLIKGFKQETVLIDNLNIPCFTHENANLTLLNLKNDLGAEVLYVYDTTEKFIYPYVKLEANDRYIIVLQPKESVEIPEGYSACTLQIEGKGTVTAFQYNARALSEFYLFYCLNNNGQYGWYQYDSVEGTFQRFTGQTPVQSVTPSEGDTQEAPSDTQANADDSELAALLKAEKNKNIMMLCIFIFVVAVLLVVIINLILSRRRSDDEEEEELEAEAEELLEEELEEESDDEAEETDVAGIAKLNEVDAESEDDEIEIEFYEMAEELPVEEIKEEVSTDSDESEDEIEIEFYDMSEKLEEEAKSDLKQETVQESVKTEEKKIVSSTDDNMDDDDDFEFIDL